MKLEFIHALTEAANPRTPHPEDAIFNGSQSAQSSLQGLQSVMQNPGGLTIKWDGFPALIFGKINGRLSIMDKYMFDKGVTAFTPEDWQEYDRNKPSGTLRPDLYQKLENIWAAMSAAVQGTGFYWGDLLYASALTPVQGTYIFKPNLVEYHVPANSALGAVIGQSIGGIVVHQYFSELGAQPQLWDGQGLRSQPGGMAIITPSAGITFTLREPVQLTKAAAASLRTYGTAVDQLFSSVPVSTRDRIKTYFNQKITNQTQLPLHEWLKTNVSGKQYIALAGDDFTGSLFINDGNGHVEESPGYQGLRAIWNSIYALKQNLAEQLEPQVQSIGQYVNGVAAGEGFVFPTPSGLVKIVNRGVFSAGLFAKKK
jgi:hypothetical protein